MGKLLRSRSTNVSKEELTQSQAFKKQRPILQNTPLSHKNSEFFWCCTKLYFHTWKVLHLSWKDITAPYPSHNQLQMGAACPPWVAKSTSKASSWQMGALHIEPLPHLIHFTCRYVGTAWANFCHRSRNSHINSAQANTGAKHVNHRGEKHTGCHTALQRPLVMDLRHSVKHSTLL